MNDYKIKELEEEMELHLIKSMKRNLQRHLDEEEKVGFKFTQWQAEKLKELKRYQRENKKIIDNYTKGLDKDVSIHLKRELNKGSINAIKLHNKALGTNLKPSRLMNHSFFKTNDRKVNNLIKVVNNDLDKANASALRMVNDQYRQIIHKSVFFSSNGVMTEKQAIDMATKDFLSSGINCIEYKNGRRVNIASYSQMAVRTASLRAQLMGEGDFRKSIGRTLVKVTSHNGACELCTGWQGKILIDDVYSGGEPDGEHILLSEAMEQGFLHPNCRHGLMTYYPEIEGIKYDEPETDIEEELQEMLKEKLNYYERQEKKYNRLKNGSLDEKNIKEYEQKYIYFENKIDVLRKELNDKDIMNIMKKAQTVMGKDFVKQLGNVEISFSNVNNVSFYHKSKNTIYLGNNANEYTLIHELGHKYYFDNKLYENKKYLKIVQTKFSRYTKKDFREFKGSKSTYYLLKDYSEFVSEYQTRIYKTRYSSFNILGKPKLILAKEYFSEGLRYYYENPQLLAKKDKELYNFIKEIVKGK